MRTCSRSRNCCALTQPSRRRGAILGECKMFERGRTWEILALYTGHKLRSPKSRMIFPYDRYRGLDSYYVSLERSKCIFQNHAVTFDVIRAQRTYSRLQIGLHNQSFIKARRPICSPPILHDIRMLCTKIGFI